MDTIQIHVCCFWHAAVADAVVHCPADARVGIAASDAFVPMGWPYAWQRNQAQRCASIFLRTWKAN